MTSLELQHIIASHPAVSAIRKECQRAQTSLTIEGLHASERAGILLAVGLPMVLTMDDLEQAMYMTSDLRTLGANAMLFPTSHRRKNIPDEALMVQRTEVLSSLSQEKMASGFLIIVTYPEALQETVPARETLSAQSLTIRRGEQFAVTALGQMLSELQFEHVDFVYQPGQYAIRGGIVDVYSYNHDDPYRLDFWGNELDSIRTFDIENQLSKERIEEVTIVGKPNKENQDEENTSYLSDYTDERTIWADCRMSKITIGNGKGNSLIRLETQPQPTFNKQFALLANDLRAKIQDGYTIYIAAEQKKQTDRLKTIFDTENEEDPSVPAIHFTPVDHALHEGFVDKQLKIAVYTDHQIFERYHRVSQQSENARRGKAIVTLKEINQLQIGDYVVHQDHGIGTFGGLVTTTANGKPQEMIRINFRDSDYIFVSIHNLNRISKYKGKETSAPTISRLGSGAWERLKERTKDKVKDIARELIKLYATRKQQPGFRYSPDSYLQHELEASFIYEDTPDQAKATQEIKHDMESPKPMDRLVCGDVGFGKTEVAIRAAFKAATDGKQVAVLVPTTVLALQHYNTFRDRLRDFPVTVEYISRAKTPKETKEIMERLAAGKIDILVGTHKLVGKNTRWKDLGLLIIDEEQKFGVSVKEKLKSLRSNVDVLTLTATPIPRTLQFSLLGARDLSVMTTPPPNRYPVQTERIGLEDEDILREAIMLEMDRNGQIFVVNNNIDMLPRVADRLQRLVPDARIVTAHGQMDADEMEKRLEDFINYEYDILVATTIIESGIDIPNVNTMIIYSAQHYGLSDLHQLRGRVGRSNRKAYCYLVTPDTELLTSDARRRLDAITTFAELGSGFNLAMQDLDIRGAGNMLGSEQSGFIADLGYDTYQKILNEAVEELKYEMHIDGPEETNEEQDSAQTKDWVADPQIDTDLPLSLPNTYVENISERINLYRELDGLKTEQTLVDYEERLTDRFGAMPEEALELMQVVRLKWVCSRLGIEKIILKNDRLTLHLTQNNEQYRNSRSFSQIVAFTQLRAKRSEIKSEFDKKTQKQKTFVIIDRVSTVTGALNLLQKIETL